MHIIYELRGKDLDPEKIEKAYHFQWNGIAVSQPFTERQIFRSHMR